MNSEKYQIIRNALINKQSIFATYEWFDREFCPYVIGYTKFEERVLWYQFWGETSQWAVMSSTECWRCFVIDKLENIEILDDEWHEDHTLYHARRNTCIEIIDVSI